MRMRLLNGLMVGIVFVVVGILLLALFTRERVIPLGEGGTIRVKRASLWRSWLGSTCELKYQRSNRHSAMISLTDSGMAYPVLIIPKDDGKVLLCLFQLEDMCCQLVRFDTTKHFEHLALRGHLDEIVRNSPWAVEVGNLDDFTYLCDFAKNMTPNELEKKTVPFPGFGRSGVKKPELMFDLNGVAANWTSLHQ